MLKTKSLIGMLLVVCGFSASAGILDQLEKSVCLSGYDSTTGLEVQQIYFCSAQFTYQRGPYIESACLSVDKARNVFVLTSDGIDAEATEVSSYGPSYDFFSKDDFSQTLSGENLVEETPGLLRLTRARWGRDEVALELNKDSMTAKFFETGEELLLQCKKLP